MANEVKRYIDDLHNLNRKENTIQSSFFTLNKAEHETGKSLLNLSSDDISSWIFGLKTKANKKLNPNTKIVYVLRLDGFYKWAIGKKLITENPVPDILRTISSEPPKAHPSLTPAEIKELIMGVGDLRRITVMLILYKTGLRRNELWHIKTTDIIMEKNRINIPNRKKNKNKDLYVLFDEEAKNYLEAYMKIRKPADSHEKALFLDNRGNRFLTPDSLVKVIDDAVKISRFKDMGITCHTFRHWATTGLSLNRCHHKVIQMLRGDSNKDMVSYYTTIPEEEVLKEYLRTIPKLGLPYLNIPQEPK